MELRYFKSIVARTVHFNGQDISWLQYIVRVIKKKEPQIISQFLKEFMAVSDIREVKEIDQYKKSIKTLKESVEKFVEFKTSYVCCHEKDEMGAFLVENVSQAEEKIGRLDEEFAKLQSDCEKACTEFNMDKKIDRSEVYQGEKSPLAEAQAKIKSASKALEEAKELEKKLLSENDGDTGDKLTNVRFIEIIDDFRTSVLTELENISIADRKEASRKRKLEEKRLKQEKKARRKEGKKKKATFFSAQKKRRKEASRKRKLEEKRLKMQKRRKKNQQKMKSKAKKMFISDDATQAHEEGR